jgi:hypothetical protein
MKIVKTLQTAADKTSQRQHPPAFVGGTAVRTVVAGIAMFRCFAIFDASDFATS